MFYAVERNDCSNNRPVPFIVFARTSLFELLIFPLGFLPDTEDLPDILLKNKYSKHFLDF